MMMVMRSSKPDELAKDSSLHYIQREVAGVPLLVTLLNASALQNSWPEL